ncbi:MAG: 6-phosphogluconolactonase [bacterium]
MTHENFSQDYLYLNKPVFFDSDSYRLRCFDSHEKMSFAASKFMLDTVNDVLSKRENCFICLAGGNTPVKCYRSFAQDLHKSSSAARKGTIHFFLGDERIVPANHPDSNTKMVCDNLVVPLSSPNVVFHAPNTYLIDTAEIATDYECRIRGLLPIRDDMPQFDLIILGLGTDGHTASIFSDTLGDHEKKGWVLPVAKSLNRAHERITLSLSVINSAHQIMFLISGKEKHPVLDQVLRRNPAFAASKIQPSHDRLLYFVSN